MSVCPLFSVLFWLACSQPARTNTELPSTEAPDRPYKPPPEGTIRDPSTHLWWEHCAEGQSGAACDGTPSVFYVEEAEDACARLNTAGYLWRLPTTEELRTLVVCPDGNLPTADEGCAEPHYNACYNPAWFPNEGEGAEYWSSDAVDATTHSFLSLNNGKAGSASVIREKKRLRCVSDGKAFVARPVSEPDPALQHVFIVATSGTPLWSEPSISAEPVGALVGGALVVAGEPGPSASWKGKDTNFVKVQGHPWTGWTLQALLTPIPSSGVLEAIDAAYAFPPGVPTGAAAMGVLPERDRLVPGQQYRLDQVNGAKATIVLQSSPTIRLGEAPASAFRWVEPQEFVCDRRQAEMGVVPPGLRNLWPRDAQACEYFEVTKVDPLFPGSNNVWRLHGEKGGFEGYFVDSKAVAVDGRPARKLSEGVLAIGGAGDAEGERCHCLRLVGLSVQQAKVLWERSWPESGATSWRIEDDGRIAGSDGSLCRVENQEVVCTP